jgi:predicted permease
MNDTIARLGRDIRYAARMLLRRPAFSATAILTLMLGLGGMTAVFSLLHALFLRPLPVERPHELVRIVERRPDGSVADSFTQVTRDILRGSVTMTDVIAAGILHGGRPDEIQVLGETRTAYVQSVSPNYFEALGVRALRGRMLHETSSGADAEPMAVISDEYWRRQFNGGLSAIGTRVRRGAREFTIAGVAPPGFRGTDVDVPADIWISVEDVVPPGAIERTRGRWMRMMGRLRPGGTPEAVGVESSALLQRPVQAQQGGIGYSALRVRLYRPMLLVAWVAALVLLIACANLANLMLAATTSRRREVAVRAAIGASRPRIVQQLLIESVLLAAVGAACGLFVARWATETLLGFLTLEQATAVPNLQFAFDARVLGFAAVLSALTCLVFGLGPALRISGSVAAADLKSGAGAGQQTRHWLTRGLLVSQVGMCTVLVIVSGVFVRTLQNLRGQDAGYREERLLIADVGFPRGYPESRRDQLIDELHARAAGLPGVEGAGFSHAGQLSGGAIEWRIGFPGHPTPVEQPIIEQRVSPGFLAAMGTVLLAGRDFQHTDDERAALVAIVNESFARQFIPGQNPIGARFFREGGSRSGQLMEIVGLVKDAKWVNLRDAPPPMYYRPYRQMGGTPVVRLAIRTSGDLEQLARDVRTLSRSIDRSITLNNVVPFSAVVDRSLVTERLVAQVSAAFGLLALMIAAIGLYGVLAYNIVRRRREIGLRIAVGAGRNAVQAMFLKESLVLLVCGVAVGVPAALAVTRLVSSMLYGLSSYDPLTIGAALTVLTAVTLAASYLPARRAARIDPIVALREE